MGSERRGRMFKGRGGLAGLVLWEQKTLGSTGLWLRVPAGEGAMAAAASHEQVRRSLCPARTASPGRERLVMPPLCPAGYRQAQVWVPSCQYFCLCHDVGWPASSETVFRSNLQGALPSVLGSRDSQSLRAEVGGRAREEGTGSHASHCQVVSTYLPAQLKNWSFGLSGQSSLSWWPGGTGVAVSASTLNTGLPTGARSPASSSTPARLQKAEREP